jgi:hypothetical protein
MTRWFALTLVAAFFFTATAAHPQDKLPEYGNLIDLKGMSKVYVSAGSTEQRNAIVNALKKHNLTVVGSPEESEFFIEHRIVEDRTPRMSLVKVYATELVAYIVKHNGQRRVA